MSLLEMIKVDCPYCGEIFETTVDCSSLDEGGEEKQEYIEDCYVCCRPIVFTVYVVDERPYVSVRSENE